MKRTIKPQYVHIIFIQTCVLLVYIISSALTKQFKKVLFFFFPENCLTYDPATPLLGIYPHGTIMEKDTCTPMFTTALFTVARTWKQLTCPLTDECIKKLWYICTMEYSSAIKRNAFQSVLIRRLNLQPIIQSEVSQMENDKY